MGAGCRVRGGSGVQGAGSREGAECTRIIPRYYLNKEWERNRESLLAYLEQVPPAPPVPGVLGP